MTWEIFLLGTLTLGVWGGIQSQSSQSCGQGAITADKLGALAGVAVNVLRIRQIGRHMEGIC